MQPEHTKLLNAAAKKILRPLGVRQKGHSRTWFDDQQWWITVIEFQPGWGQGSYLNVGAMWLWYEKDYFSFDDGHRVEEFHPFQDEAQFLPIADALAKRAADEVVSYRLRFRSIEDVACHLAARTPRDFWTDFHTAIACGLSRDRQKAERFFADVINTTNTPNWAKAAVSRAREYNSLLADMPTFHQRISEVVVMTRSAMKLDEIPDFRFDSEADRLT